MAEPISYVFDPKIGLPLDIRTVLPDSNNIIYPYVGQMFYDKSMQGFYYIDRLINSGAGYTKKSIFLSNSNALGNLTVTSLTTGELFLLSDAARKEGVEPISNATAALNDLHPVTYTLNLGDGQAPRDSGFLAQEVASTPLAFMVRDNHVKYNSLIAYLVGAVQELDARVAQLESRAAMPQGQIPCTCNRGSLSSP
jgi:Chaperone of endosialidase